MYVTRTCMFGCLYTERVTSAFRRQKSGSHRKRTFTSCRSIELGDRITKKKNGKLLSSDESPLINIHDVHRICLPYKNAFANPINSNFVCGASSNFNLTLPIKLCTLP